MSVIRFSEGEYVIRKKDNELFYVYVVLPDGTLGIEKPLGEYIDMDGEPDEFEHATLQKAHAAVTEEISRVYEKAHKKVDELIAIHKKALHIISEREKASKCSTTQT